MRAVLDVNVLLSALLSRDGAPARIVAAWLDGAFELVVSPALIGELRRALAYPKIRRRVPEADADSFVSMLQGTSIALPDSPGPPPYRSADPDDDYFVALAAASGSMLVTGDVHLLELADRAPVHTPREFLELIG